jgi:hypothetical protein
MKRKERDERDTREEQETTADATRNDNIHRRIDILYYTSSIGR